MNSQLLNARKKILQIISLLILTGGIALALYSFCPEKKQFSVAKAKVVYQALVTTTSLTFENLPEPRESQHEFKQESEQSSIDFLSIESKIIRFNLIDRLLHNRLLILPLEIFLKNRPPLIEARSLGRTTALIFFICTILLHDTFEWKGIPFKCDAFLKCSSMLLNGIS